ncbi:MAG: hypothetical protein ACE5Q6_20845 [Dehalococcoidia bacterium]
MTTPVASVIIRLFIFSGRPDPEWTLGEQATQELQNRVEGTIGGDATDAAPQGGLGYRGFLIQNREELAGLPTEFTVFRGVLSETRSGRVSNWRDNGGVESWLLAQAREQGHGEILDAFGVEEDGTASS